MRYNETNYFKETATTFRQIANIESDIVFNKRNTASKNYVRWQISKILKIDEKELKNLAHTWSYYFKGGEKLIRVSNHGGKIGTCYGRLRTFKKIGEKYKGNVGVVNFKNFKHNKDYDPLNK